jgi:uncharacterized membrane protein SpoIIM required for sporulation
VIVDLERFVAAERGTWEELERLLDRLDDDLAARLTLEEVKRLSYLYQRTSADLARIGPLAGGTELREYLEALVSRGYAEIHDGTAPRARFSFRNWFLAVFPVVFRRRFAAFRVAILTMLAGCIFGAAVLAFDPADKEVLLPFSHLLGSPAERVAREETKGTDDLSGKKVTFSSYLMTHNTRVAVFCLAMGITFGVGTLVLLFYNGVILGAVAFDYVAAGKTAFLLGWLLPHGIIEIPAILVAGQGGLVLAAALLGRSEGAPLRERLRRVGPDLVSLIGGVAVMLVWAGLVEGLLSQYHEPVLPYPLKIGFGMCEGALLVLFLSRGGAAKTAEVHRGAV